MPSKTLRAEDLLVEFRDKDLIRRGSIPLDDLSLKMQPVFNGVGSWSLNLPAEHRAVPYLRTPGSGIIVTNLVTGDILMSGSTSRPSKKQTSADTEGMLTIAGLDDNRLVFDARAFPQPTNADPSTQTESHDVRIGNGESLIRQYVAFNIGGAQAPAGRVAGLRSKLRLEVTNKNLGFVTTQRARFDVLGDLVNKIAIESGGLGWRIVQIGSELVFQVYQPTDRSAFIRLDVKNGTLQETNVEHAPPEVTRVIVAGQGDLVDRQFVQVTTPESLVAEDDWGFVIEEFKDQRNTDVDEELETSGLGILAERGFTKFAIKATPANDQTMIFLSDFFLGDRVAIVVDGQEQPNSNITEAAIVIDESGMRTAVAIGDIKDFDSTSALRSTVNDNTRRIAEIERNVEVGSPSYGTNDFWLDGTTVRSMRGTTAQRNAHFGTPATDASRSALANRRVTWFNTDLGWEESFYAPAGTAGLTAPGLLAGTAPGWYPTGEGPESKMYASGTQNVVAGTYITQWSPWGTGGSSRRGGDDWFVRDAATVVCKKAGVYEVSGMSSQQAGSGATVTHILRSGQTIINCVNTLNASYVTTAPLYQPAVAMNADQNFSMYAGIGSYQLFVSTGNVEIRGFLHIRYKGPLLASD